MFDKTTSRISDVQSGQAADLDQFAASDLSNKDLEQGICLSLEGPTAGTCDPVVPRLIELHTSGLS